MDARLPADPRRPQTRGPFRHRRGERRSRAAILPVAGLVLAAALAPACGTDGRGGDGSPAARDSVLAELRAYYRVLSARDWETFPDHFWPDATITTVWGPEGGPGPRVWVQTAAEFAEAGPEGPGSREIFEEEMVSHRAEVDATAGVATVWADYRARFGDPGDVAEWEGTDVFTLLRHDGRWRIASLVFVPDRGDGSGDGEGPPGGEGSGP